LNAQINSFQPQLDGILASYGTIFLKTGAGTFLNDETHVHIDIVADFNVFRPKVGAQIQGVVIKRSASHVSVLTHGCFNVTCYRPSGEDEDWCGAKAKVNQMVRFTVLKTDLSQKIPFIMGSLQEESVKENIMAPKESWVTDDHSGEQQKSKVTKFPKVEESEDSGIDSLRQQQLTTTNEKKRKRGDSDDDENENEGAVASTPLATSSHIKKRRKTLEVEPEVKEEEESDVSSSKKKKKKKKSKEVAEVKDEPMDDADDSVLQPSAREALDMDETLTTSSKKKKKKKDKQAEQEAEEAPPSSKKKKKSKRRDEEEDLGASPTLLRTPQQDTPLSPKSEPEDEDETPSKSKKKKKKSKK